MADIKKGENNKVTLISVGLILALNRLQGLKTASRVQCPVVVN